MFKEGDIVVAKDEFVEFYEEPKDTLGVVRNYIKEDDYLVIAYLENYKKGLPQTFSTRGQYYQIATKEDLEKMGVDISFLEKDDDALTR